MGPKCFWLVAGTTGRLSKKRGRGGGGGGSL